MKLVDILARELKVWPDDEYHSIGQACNGTLHKSPNWNVDCGWTKEAYTMADDWSRVFVYREEWQAAADALKAESAPAWVGLGLPPIGSDVEVFADYSHPSFDRFIGRQVHIVAHDVINGDPVAVFRMPVIDGDQQSDQDYHAMVAGSFRQIRTPEQIAAEERDRSIGEMREIWNFAASSGADPFIALYAAGYRKFEIVDN